MSCISKQTIQRHHLLLQLLLASHVTEAAELFPCFDLVEAWLALWLALPLGLTLLGGRASGSEVRVSVLLPSFPLLVLEVALLEMNEAPLLAHLGHPALVVIVVGGVLFGAATALRLFLLLLLGLPLWLGKERERDKKKPGCLFLHVCQSLLAPVKNKVIFNQLGETAGFYFCLVL